MAAAPGAAHAGYAAGISATPKPAGPYHVSGGIILDSLGHPYVIRGTELTAVTSDPTQIAGSGNQFGALSRTTLATIRFRLNMNAVRLPITSSDYERNRGYRDRVREVVRNANLLELLVILAGDTGASANFWSSLAACFRDNPNVFFAIPAPGDPVPLVALIRAFGATQPIIVPAESGSLHDPNVIYEVTPRYGDLRTELDRQEKLGGPSEQAPLLVNGLDPGFDESTAECADIPSDPSDAARLVEDNLNYFDRHHISWTISSFRPRRLISDFHFLYGTTLDYGWTCGQPAGMLGLGMILLSHLWNSGLHDLFTVHPTTGNFMIARGGAAAAYGPTMADRDAKARPGTLPLKLANISVRVTDSQGVARMAPLLYTGAGWSFLSFIMPAASATGLAKIEVLRSDGSRAVGKAVVADVASGLYAAAMDGRGAANAWFSQRSRKGITNERPSFECSPPGCSTVPIPLSREAATTLRMEGVGFRWARSSSLFRVSAGDVDLPLVSFGPSPGNPGRDQLTVRLPDQLIGRGEIDMFMSVDGLISNIVRINAGSAP
jgi:uncharacterized protein (TIGR03437 family)